MGLFKEIYCAECGLKTNIFTRTKLADGNYICSKCTKEIPSYILECVDGIYTLEDFRNLKRHIQKSKEEYEPIFQETHSYKDIHLDAFHGLFYFKEHWTDSIVYFPLSHIVEFDLSFSPDELKEGIIGDILISLLLLSGCNNECVKSYGVRLAEDYDMDWAREALGTLNNDTIYTNTTVAILDTGCNLKQPNILEGYSVVDNSSNCEDESGHGTIISTKLIDINSKINIIPIKVSNNGEDLTSKNLINGIRYAIDRKVDIISISMGLSKNYPEIETIVQEAINNDIILIASSGNNGGDIMYPAAYKTVISVMARDINNQELSFNGKNKNKRSFSAPGEHILCGNQYITGTSVATLYITAAVAFLKSFNSNYSNKQIFEILKESSLYPSEYSYGIINYDKLQEIIKSN